MNGDCTMLWVRSEWLAWDTGIITYLVITVLVTITMVWYFKRQKTVWLLNQIPGPKGLPILGNALYLYVDPPEFFRRTLKVTEYGEVARLWMAHNPYCLLSSAKAAEVILSSQKYLKKSFNYDFAHPWVGISLLTSTGSHWQTRRKLLTPAFHFKILEEFMSVFNKQSNKLIQKLEKKADGNTFDIYDDLTLCALDIICETAMGAQHQCQETVKHNTSNCQGNKFSDTIVPLSCVQVSELFPFFSKQDHIARPFMVNMVNDSRCLCFLLYRIKNRRAFLDLLLEYSEENPDFNDEEIRKEVDTFMFAGHDTTASAINSILYILGLHPDIQTKEAYVWLASSRLFQTKEANVWLASSRLFHRLKKQMCENYRVPSGTTVQLVIYKIHRDPAQFPDTEVFDPDRFLPENVNKRHPYAYIPFSAGPRNCIGKIYASER
nr:cytochrome P450 4C1-like [Cherax quadricarinatus]